MYKEMYYHLFNVILDALKSNNAEEMKQILIKGQQETEEMYMSCADDNIIDFTSHS